LLHLFLCVLLCLSACSRPKLSCPPGTSIEQCRASSFTSTSARKIRRSEKLLSPVIDTRRINRPPTSRSTRVVPIVGYVGSLRVDYTPTKDTLQKDLNELFTATKGQIKQEEQVTLNFNNATLSYFLQQVLEGILKVNYVTPHTNMTEAVNLRTDAPVPKGQLLWIVRDILARHGYAMRMLNGIYHIDNPAVISNMRAAATIGSAYQSRLVHVRSGHPNEIIAFARKMLDNSVYLSPASGNRVLVRAISSDIEAAANLIETLAEGGIGEERVAIMPLHRSDPVKIAAQLSAFYQERLGASRVQEELTIIPLPAQQSILVGTRDRYIMAGLRKLLSSMDSTSSDEHNLRVIQLLHLQAEEVVEQLSTIFSDKIISSSKQSKTQKGSTGEEKDTSSGDESQQRATAVPEKENLLKLVADTRNNVIMIYSNYALFKRIRTVLKGIDVAQPQVVIRATVVEVFLTKALEYGVKWFLSDSENFIMNNQPSFAGTTGRPTLSPGGGLSISGGLNNLSQGLGLSSVFGNVTVDSVLRALRKVTDIKVVSAPYVTVLNNKTARLLVGDQIPFVTKTDETTGSAGVKRSENIEIKDTGIILEVTPHISANNTVRLQINQSVSVPRRDPEGVSGTQVVATRSITSDILVKSGSMVMLGGLIQGRRSKDTKGIPILGDMPILGNLFRVSDTKNFRVELLVMITPHVIRSSSKLEHITEMLRSRLAKHLKE